MRRHSATHRIRWGALAALCALAAAGATLLGGVHRERGWLPLAPVETTSPFRLGTAARPFAWSTAVGDLNADGRPDYAVADRIGRTAGGFQYSLLFSVSGLESRSITFSSPDSALSVSLRDVDHDQDLDVVVSTIVSPTVVRVWLNDGRGSFSETAEREVVYEWRVGPALATDQDAASALVAVAPPRRGRDAARPAIALARPLSAFSVLTAGAPADLVASARNLRQPRAPPSSALRCL